MNSTTKKSVRIKRNWLGLRKGLKAITIRVETRAKKVKKKWKNPQSLCPRSPRFCLNAALEDSA